MEGQAPKVGIGLMILKDGRVLLGKRKGSHGTGEYAFPGGHLEYMESFTDSALRELAEECGADFQVSKPQFLLVANVRKYAPKHYVHLTLLAQWQGGEPVVMEPEKSEGWGWYALDALPSPLFDMCRLSVESYQNGRIYYDFPEQVT
ncbi:MAG TPA: DNA mismatch repair protein MutT [Rhodospirillaceae bacterium]|nr:MAG: hypothetical protein A2018_02655 [Alphaproteobacteria bacterium GWF2_58_20]HAU29452.1 DNA mismatch repair protein MutT [Rhodospirillaceae bacterium]